MELCLATVLATCCCRSRLSASRLAARSCLNDKSLPFLKWEGMARINREFIKIYGLDARRKALEASKKKKGEEKGDGTFF